MRFEAASKTPAPGFYIPGYAKCKMLMILYGIVLFVLGTAQIWTPLSLVITGKSVHAEVISVIKAKAGLPDVIIKKNSKLKNSLEQSDRSFLFWNEFKFNTADGKSIQVRAPVGSLLKPIYSITDLDGLPTTDLIFYSPTHPETVVFPFIVSTWFAACALMTAGVVAMLIGFVLLVWADRPIRLPSTDLVNPPSVNRLAK